MVNLLADLYDHQGKCERIKNFPYPRQFATLNLFFVWLFVGLVPFGLLQEFAELGPNFAWMTIPASVIVSWVFHTMDKIGESSENPFEGGPNDVPITALSRTIEIDLRELLGEQDIPPALQAVNDILM
jgi:putative membrane protein